MELLSISVTCLELMGDLTAPTAKPKMDWKKKNYSPLASLNTNSSKIICGHSISELLDVIRMQFAVFASFLTRTPDGG